MIDAIDSLERRLTALRSDFDRSFGEPFAAPAAEPAELLAITLGGDPYAIRVRELRGVHAHQVVTTLPTAAPDLVGLAAIRGELVAVYDLAALLGYTRCPAPRHVLLSRTTGLGFAFDSSSRHLRMPQAAITTRPESSAAWLTEVVREADFARPIIELAAVCAAVEARIRSEVTEENR